MLQVVIFSVKLEMGQDEEPVMKTFYATQMEFVSQFVQFKDLKAMGLIEDHALRVEFASEMVLVNLQVWNYELCLICDK